MAVDTKIKRLSIINFATISTDTLPEPDGSIDKADRFTLLDIFLPAVIPVTGAMGSMAEKMQAAGF